MSQNINQNIDNIDNNYQPPKASLNTKHLDISKHHSLEPYPKARIILSYTFLGGMLGGLILWIGFSVIEPRYVFVFEAFFVAIIGGGIIGFIPALIASLIIVYLKTYRSVIADDIKVFAIGASVSAFLTFIFRVIMGYDSFVPLSSLSDAVLIALAMGVVGGLSSLIIGYFVIPED